MPSVFFSQRSPLRQFLLRFLSTSLSAWQCPTYHASSVRRHLRLAVAIGISCSRTNLCSAIFHVSLSWHVSGLLLTSPTLDSLFLSWEEHEEERETRGIVSELKEAASSEVCNHSSLLSSLSTTPKSKNSRLPFIIHPSISLFTNTFCVFCAGPSPQMPTCTISVFPSKWFSLSTISWYFFNFESCFPKFHSILLLLKTTVCSIVPRTEYQTPNPIPCPSLLPHAGKLYFLLPTRDPRKFQHKPSLCIAWWTPFASSNAPPLLDSVFVLLSTPFLV